MQRSQQYQKQHGKAYASSENFFMVLLRSHLKLQATSPPTFLIKINSDSHQQILVVDDLKTNLLGLPAIIALHLVTRTLFRQKPLKTKVGYRLGSLSGDYTFNTF